MKKFLTLTLSVIMALSLAVSASAADLSEVLPNANAGTKLDGYHFDNHLNGMVVPEVLTIEFDLTVTGPINPYATIFCYHKDDGNARFCFTLGGGMIYNDWAGTWFDAGLHEGIYENIFEPYIGSTVHVKMTFDYDKFELYLDDEYKYGSDTLESNLNAAGPFYGENLPEEYMSISLFIMFASKLDFGYNSWWKLESADVTNAEIADFAIYCDGNLMAKYFVGGVAGENEFHTEDEYAPETTEPETEEPETTEAETDEPSVTTDAPAADTEPADEGGCGGALGASALVVTLVGILGTALIKKSN